MNSDDRTVPAADPDDPPPVRPSEPDAADCCGEGCVRCVYDVYEEALERYETASAAWRLRHPPHGREEQACG
ncbi:oxidoreductase-like domain-containing protein [Rhodanobacter ginsengiterrae]|uniref:oxidoreductase-like domain-containing protein n=1 Tax=Rhodanobacter ginsengiterrae TaxID=2008451 RepID=UPI003CF8A975